MASWKDCYDSDFLHAPPHETPKVDPRACWERAPDPAQDAPTAPRSSEELGFTYIYIYIHMICLLCIMYNRYSLYSIDIWSLYICQYVNSYVYIYVYLNIDIILHYNTIHMCHGQNNWTLFLVIAGIKPWLRLFGSSWSIWDETCFCGSLSWDWLIDW